MFGPKKSEHKEDLASAKAVFDTTLGSFTIDLFVKECPETVWNFINLAEGVQETTRKGPFYDGLIFHRVIEGFMIQGGCPEGSGRGNPGYRFGDEFHAQLKHDGAGILSMANAGPGTNGSQFFITLAATPHLNGRHTVFGKVTEGMDIIKKIGTCPTNAQDRPLEEISIRTVKILRNS
ncbi:MAG: peptidylprolyl isomerase [Bacteriovoracaceae bacterium]|nr:peptidylprolyl isomerase [Bacteriovoracaceae bacterium]